jgi:uncharacterized membrane protein SirB2
MDYLPLKHAHAGFAYLSALLFLVRFGLLYVSPGLLKNTAVKVLPHLIDTALLIAAIALLVMGPFGITDLWVIGKIVGLLVLIGAGVVAIKRRNPLMALVTLAMYGYLIGVAKTKSIASWLLLV